MSFFPTGSQFDLFELWLMVIMDSHRIKECWLFLMMLIYCTFQWTNCIQNNTEKQYLKHRK